jgi:hypothetical protein
VARVAKAAVGV